MSGKGGASSFGGTRSFVIWTDIIATIKPKIRYPNRKAVRWNSVIILAITIGMFAATMVFVFQSQPVQI